MSEFGDCRDNCPIAATGGYCARHKIHKTEAWTKLCRLRESYWKAWEAGIGAGQIETPAPPMPKQSLPRKLKRYAKAIRKWNKAGRPVRTDREVADIYFAHCLVCDHYDAEKGVCRLCGCKVCGREGRVFSFFGVELPTKAKAMLNKIRMATEHCPNRKW